MSFREIAEGVGILGDALGVAVLAFATIAALASFTYRVTRRSPGDHYRRLRIDIGRGILLGLEILVAADIIRTVAIEPSIDSLIVLAGIVLIRTFLSFALEVELTGRWPWQRRPAEAAATEPPPAGHGL